MSNAVDNMVKTITKAIDNSHNKKTAKYETMAEVTHVDGDTVWVHIPGGVQETPVKKTIDAKKGDTVKVSISKTGSAIIGNTTAPPTDDTTAKVAQKTADGAQKEAERAKEAADTAWGYADQAYDAAVQAQGFANEAKTSAIKADDQAKSATNSANNALAQLSTVENVVDTLTWIAEHSAFKRSTDTSVVSSKTYYMPNNQVLTMTDGTTKINGLTIVIKDGVVTVNGTATQSTYFELGIPNVTAGNYIYLSGVSGGSLQTYALRYAEAGGATFVYDDTVEVTAVNNKKYYVYISNGYTATDLVFYPRISIVNDGLEYSIVDSPSGNPSLKGYYELDTDEAVKTYVQTHLALTEEGLFVVKDNSGYKVKINNYGMYVQAPNAQIVNQNTADGNIIKATDGTIIANLGYGEGAAQSGTATAPYYILGTRKSSLSSYNSFSTSSTYSIGDMCLYNNNLYVCIKNITTAGAWTGYTNWSLVCESTMPHGNYAVEEGYNNLSTFFCAHAEGRNNFVKNDSAHVEGRNNIAVGLGSHAEGGSGDAGSTATNCIANGTGSHAEGGQTRAIYQYSHSEGFGTLANAFAAHAGGYYTIANGNYQTAIGKYNKADTTSAFIIGKGGADHQRDNALEVDWYGNVNIASGAKYKINGTDLAASDVGAVPTSRTVNSKALSSNITLSASDVGAVPTSRTVNSKALSSNISLTASDVGAVPTSRTVNGKALSSNISLTASDVGALASSDVYGMFSVSGANITSSDSLAAGDYKTYTYTYARSGYYPLCVARINSSGSNSTFCSIIRYGLTSQSVGSCDISVTVRNVASSSAATLTLAVYVLWVKTS